MSDSPIKTERRGHVLEVHWIAPRRTPLIWPPAASWGMCFAIFGMILIYGLGS